MELDAFQPAREEGSLAPAGAVGEAPSGPGKEMEGRERVARAQEGGGVPLAALVSEKSMPLGNLGFNRWARLVSRFLHKSLSPRRERKKIALVKQEPSPQSSLQSRL